MRALVTGCAGFIGTSLCSALCSEGHEVVGIDRFDGSLNLLRKEENLKYLRSEPGFSLVNLDLATGPMEKIPAGGYDVVFHLAARAEPRMVPGRSRADWWRDNVIATDRLYTVLVGRNIKKVIFTSAAAVYGRMERHAFSENNLPAPVTSLGISKLAAERLAHVRRERFHAVPINLRLFCVYGPKQRPDQAVHSICRSLALGETFHICGTGAQTRDMTFVDDVIYALMRAYSQGSPGGVYNVSGRTRLSVSDLVEKLFEISGIKVPVIYTKAAPEDPENVMADLSKSNTQIQYEPAAHINSALKTTWKWFRKFYESGSRTTDNL